MGKNRLSLWLIQFSSEFGDNSIIYVSTLIVKNLYKTQVRSAVCLNIAHISFMLKDRCLTLPSVVVEGKGNEALASQITDSLQKLVSGLYLNCDINLFHLSATAVE